MKEIEALIKAYKIIRGNTNPWGCHTKEVEFFKSIKANVLCVATTFLQTNIIISLAPQPSPQENNKLQTLLCCIKTYLETSLLCNHLLRDSHCNLSSIIVTNETDSTTIFNEISTTTTSNKIGSIASTKNILWPPLVMSQPSNNLEKHLCQHFWCICSQVIYSRNQAITPRCVLSIHAPNI